MATKTATKTPGTNGKTSGDVTSEMYSEFTQVTPDMAQNWLHLNSNNRKLIEYRAEAIARDMSSGRWKKTHQGIAIMPDGTLGDGQHRLQAVVMSGRTVGMWVFYNVPQEVLDAVDRGSMRGLEYAMRHIFHVKDPKRTSVVINILGDAAHIYARSKVGSHATATIGESEALYMRYKEAHDVILGTIVDKRVHRAIQAALVFAYEFSPVKVLEFAQRHNDGAGLEEGSPMLVLRHTMDALPKSTWKRNVFNLALSAIYNHIHRRKPKKLTENDAALAYFGIKK